MGKKVGFTGSITSKGTMPVPRRRGLLQEPAIDKNTYLQIASLAGEELIPPRHPYRQATFTDIC